MSVLVTVNGEALTVEDALRHSLLDSGASRWLAELIDRELLRQYAKSQSISVSDEELQRAADEMRYDRGLQTSAQTLEWVNAHGQTLESAQAELEALLRRNRIAASIPESEVESFYRERAADLEYVVLFSIRVATETEAAALLERLRNGEQFPAVAAAHSADPVSRAAGGWVGKLRRAEVAPEIAEAVFAAEPGNIVGPIRTAKGYNVFLVAARRTPTLDEERSGIRWMLFEELLTRLRSSARIAFPALAAVGQV
jgi:parvulin-like peptidyl-prolyl isomerase